MNKHYIWVRVNTQDELRLINKLYNTDIYYEELKKDKEYVYLKIDYNNYNRLKKYLISYKVSIYKDTGIYKYLDIFKSNKSFFITLFISIILLIVVNNMSFNIVVKTNDLKIKNTILNSLNETGIRKVGFKKNHKEIEKIVEKILNNNKNTLEWLEIKYDGFDMVVLVTKKVKKESKSEKNICNIVAKSDGKIVSFNIKKGEVVTRINQYVYRGDILVSSIVKNNEEVKDLVCSSGTVYAEVWYKVNVSVPFERKEYIKSGKSKYNIRVTINDNKYKIFRSRFKKYKEKSSNIYELNDFKIDLVKESEVELKKKILNEKEALEEGLKLVNEKMKLKLKEDESIVEKKVLKNTIKDSTMVLEVFVVTKESIGKVVTVEEGSINDKSDTGESS